MQIDRSICFTFLSCSAEFVFHFFSLIAVANHCLRSEQLTGQLLYYQRNGKNVAGIQSKY